MKLRLLMAAYTVASGVQVTQATFAKYPHLAESLKQGRLSPERAGDASPLYLLLNWLLSPTFLRFVQLALAAFTIGAVFALTEKLHSRKAAWCAAIILSIAEPWLIYSGVLEPDICIASLNVFGLLALVEERAITSGICFGASIALRPSALPFVALVLVLKRRHALKIAAVAVLTVLLPIGLLRIVAGQDVRATMAAGQTFHQGHRPERAGMRAGYPVFLKMVEMTVPQDDSQPDEAHMLYRRFASVDQGGELSALEAERFWLEKALAFAITHPGAFASDLLHKAIFAFAAPGKDADIPAVLALKQRPVIGIPSQWITLLALSGLLLAFNALLAAAYLTYGAVFVLFYFQSRYGLVLIPFAAALSGIALAELSQRPKRLPLALLPFGLALLPFVRHEAKLEARNLSGFPDTVLPWSNGPRGGDANAFTPDTPVDAYLKATLEPNCTLALADLQHADGFHSAITDVALNPELLRSDCLVATKDPEQAAAAISRSLDRYPGTIDGLARASAAAKKGFLKGAFEDELFLLHDAASAHYALSRALRRWNNPQEALKHADWLLALLPESAPLAQHERAQALADLGRMDEARIAHEATRTLTIHLPGASRFNVVP